MIDSGVSPGIVLQLVERDCVDFEVTPEVLSELSAAVPQEVLEAAIACRSGSAAAAFDSAARVSCVHVRRGRLDRLLPELR